VRSRESPPCIFERLLGGCCGLRGRLAAGSFLVRRRLLLPRVRGLCCKTEKWRENNILSNQRSKLKTCFVKLIQPVLATSMRLQVEALDRRLQTVQDLLDARHGVPHEEKALRGEG
jgi:hypothetical protein